LRDGSTFSCVAPCAFRLPPGPAIMDAARDMPSEVVIPDHAVTGVVHRKQRALVITGPILMGVGGLAALLGFAGAEEAQDKTNAETIGIAGVLMFAAGTGLLIAGTSSRAFIELVDADEQQRQAAKASRGWIQSARLDLRPRRSGGLLGVSLSF
jgi:hypothetical protein